MYIGAEARILETKGKWEEGNQKDSVGWYILVGRDGNRFIVRGREIAKKIETRRITSNKKRQKYYFKISSRKETEASNK